MTELHLSRGFVAIVDDSDVERLSVCKWSYHHTGYAHGIIGGRRVLMHRFILGAAPGMEVDHVDSDRLNNRRANLRLCLRAENMRNRPVQKNNVSGFKGVSRNARGDGYRAYIKRDRRQVYLGSFASAREAADAYDRAAVELHGVYAKTNRSLGLMGESNE